MGMHLFMPPPPLRSKAQKLPEDVAELVHDMLVKDKRVRPDMSSVLDRLEPMLSKYGDPKLVHGLSRGFRPVVAGFGVRSTLGLSTGQSLEKSRSRRWKLTALCCAIVGIVVSGGFLVRKSRQRPVLPQVAAPAAPTLAPRAPLLAAPPSRVTWRINTTPSGAQVIRVSDQKILGTTPYKMERPVSAGSVWGTSAQDVWAIGQSGILIHLPSP